MGTLSSWPTEYDLVPENRMKKKRKKAQKNEWLDRPAIGPWEGTAGGSGVQGYLLLHIELMASPDTGDLLGGGNIKELEPLPLTGQSALTGAEITEVSSCELQTWQEAQSIE